MEGSRALSRGEPAPERPSFWLRLLVGPGYASKGVVYLVIGVLSAQAAIGMRRRAADQSAVFEAVLEQPFGVALLIALSLGLVGYALWRLGQALFDPQGEGGGASATVKRLAYAASALAYLVFAYAAGRLAVSAGRDSVDLSVRGWTARLMEQPLGEALVGLLGLAMLGLLGLAMLGAGLYQGYHGLAAKFCSRLLMARMNAFGRWVCLVSGVVGHLARGVVFGVIGVFLLRAALAADPDKARGIGGALESLLEHRFGSWFLLAVAAGLVVYGLYAFLEGLYQRMSPRR